MLKTIKIKLQPSKEQHSSLLSTMYRYNYACNYIGKIVFDEKIYGKISLQKRCYYEVREKFGLSAQMTLLAIRKVVDSYKKNKKTERFFRETGAVAYDPRILTLNNLNSVSILTLDGRIKVPVVFGKYHLDLLKGKAVKGQTDLILEDGVFYLMFVVDVPDVCLDEPKGFLGVDLGIVNLAVDSEGEVFSGAVVKAVRERNKRTRERLQKKHTKSAKRLLKKRAKKEARFCRDVNHCISKKLVEKSKALGFGIALEDLKGIRTRTEKTVKKAQRYQHSSWSFHQLRSFIAYKAKQSGVALEIVDARNTSRTCPVCGHTSKNNRPTRDDFRCRKCNYAGYADNIAAVNIKNRAVCQSAKRREEVFHLQAQAACR